MTNKTLLINILTSGLPGNFVRPLNRIIMSYRTQEILRMIIPGLYLIVMLLIIFLYRGGWDKIVIQEQNTIIEVMKGHRMWWYYFSPSWVLSWAMSLSV